MTIVAGEESYSRRCTGGAARSAGPLSAAVERYRARLSGARWCLAPARRAGCSAVVEETGTAESMRGLGDEAWRDPDDKRVEAWFSVLFARYEKLALPPATTRQHSDGVGSTIGRGSTTRCPLAVIILVAGEPGAE